VNKESLRKHSPVLFTRLESIHDRMALFCQKHGLAFLAWDAKSCQIACLHQGSRQASVIETQHPERVIGYFDAAMTFAELEETVLFYFLALPDGVPDCRSSVNNAGSDNMAARRVILCP